MILNDNIATQIGDVIIFKTIPIFNLTAVTNYTDDITGTTVDKYFYKEFCYSFDGVVFNEYRQLTDPNLLEINNFLTVNNIKSVLIVKFRYERQGVDNTGNLQFNSVNLVGIYNILTKQEYPVGKSTIYKDFVYDDVDTFNLMVNLAKKMYDYGIIPVYLDRQEVEGDLLIDKDYIDFWQTIAKLFSVIYIDSIKYTVIYWNRDLLCEFLKQKNIIVCDCADIKVLQLIAKNYYDEIRQRGTEQIFHKKDYRYYFLNATIFVIDANNLWHITPTNYVQIDGIKYYNEDELPHGWMWFIWSEDNGEFSDDFNNDFDNTNIGFGTLLIAPDKNYHEVLFFNNVDILECAIDNNYFGTTALDYLTSRYFFKKRYNGEYLRLICYKGGDMFLYNIPQKKYFGWCVGRHSPMYKGLRQQYNNSLIVKNRRYDTNSGIKNGSTYNDNYIHCQQIPIYDLHNWVNTKVMNDFVQFDLLNLTYDSAKNYVIDTLPIVNENRKVFRPLDSAGGTFSTIYSNLDNLCYEEQEIPYGSYVMVIPEFFKASKNEAIDDKIDYEISFWIKADNLTECFSLYIETFDKNGNKLQPKNVFDLSNENWFVKYAESIMVNNEQWLFIKNILYRHDVHNYEDFLGKKPDCNVGTNLIMQQGTRFFVMRIRRENDTNNFSLFNFVMKPLRTPYSKCFVQSGNFIELWRKNNNKDLNENEVNNLAQTFLFPYNTFQKTINL